MNKASYIRILILIFIIVALALSAASIMLDAQNGIFIVYSLITLNLFIGSQKGRNRLPYLLFNCTFFTFLLSMLFIQKLKGITLFTGYSENTRLMIYLCLSLSLIGITIGQLLSEKYARKNLLCQYIMPIPLTADEYLGKNNRLIVIVTCAFYITYPFSFLDIVNKAIYVGNTSYLDYYTTYISSIPYIFIKIGELNMILFAMLCCVEFRRRRLVIPIILYVLVLVISLGIGQRNIFVLGIIMLVVGLLFANQQSQKYTGGKLYNHKLRWLLYLAIPIGIIFLNFIGNARLGKPNTSGLLNNIEDFFVSQGRQVNFLADTIEWKDEIWSQPVPYSFAAPYNYFRNLLGLRSYGTYTAENAYYGNSLAATQFFIMSPGSLLSGRGSGSCYISELYYDFGIIGVLLGNILIGAVLGRLSLKEHGSYWMNAFSVLMIRWIVYIPRSSYLDWISYTFNIWNVVLVFIVYMLASNGRMKAPKGLYT